MNKVELLIVVLLLSRVQLAVPVLQPTELKAYMFTD